MPNIPGLVVRTQSGFYTVETEAGLLTCQLRGRLKRGPKVGDIAAIGDRVLVSRIGRDHGVIEEIEERQRALVRQAPKARGEYQQVIIANPDQVIFVFAAARPQPKLGMLDRYLIIAEKQRLPTVIVVNKADLAPLEEIEEMFDRYRSLGYGLLITSVKTGLGISDLRQLLTGKLSAFAGPSGVGKSSLLNAVQPGLGLDVSAISEATGKGRHTTVVRQLFPLDGGGYVADTPGMKTMGLWDIEPAELDGYFPEIRPLVEKCDFNDCSHMEEPGCAVLAALERGEIHPERYRSYVQIRTGAEEEEEGEY